MAGQSTDTLTLATTLTHVLGLGEEGTRRQTISNLALQLLASPELAALIGAPNLFQGEWDASSGSFPAGAEKGQYWRVSASGTVDSVSFAQSDTLIALVDDASTSTYATNWHRAPFASFDHTHDADQISDSTAAGRALLTALTAAAQRALLELGTAAQSDAADFTTPSEAASMVGQATRTVGIEYLLYEADDDPEFVISDTDGQPIVHIGADGQVYTPVAFDLFEDDDAPGFVILDADGNPVFQAAPDGTPIHPPEYHLPDDEFDDYVVALADADGVPLTQPVDAEGDPIPHPAPMPMPVVEGGAVHILAAEQTELVDLGTFTVSQVESYRKDAVRGVIDRPWAGDKTSVVFAPGLITGDDEITIATTETYSGSGGYVTIGKSIDQTDPRTAAAIPRTNICDSAGHVSGWQRFPEPNWAVHQTITV